MPSRVRLRDDIWRVESEASVSGQTLYQLRHEESGLRLTAVCPPDVVEAVHDAPPAFDRRALSPFGVWQLRHELIRLTSTIDGLAAVHAGRVQIEPYQLVPVSKLLRGSHRNLLIADDVGLGKTIEAGFCILELMARHVAKRVLLVVPPGLVDQWLEEMQRKFGLAFKSIEDSASLDQAQTELAEGLSPWAFHDRVITSVEYLKRPGVYGPALRRPWDVIVVDEAHYLAESGSPANPYSTQRTKLGARLRAATRSLILLTATPHNGYRHSFRSLLELVEPTDAALVGDADTVKRRVSRSMLRRLKQQITRTGPDGQRVPAFVPRAPVDRLDVHCGTADEREIFSLVTKYCSRTAEAAAGSDQRDLVSFAMQIVKKRMLSSRLALSRTIEHRLEALRGATEETGPSRADLRELQGDLPLPEVEAERVEARVLRTAVPSDARRRNAETRQLREVKRALDRVAELADPKIARLVDHLRDALLPIPQERAIVFTEYRDSLESIRTALAADPDFAGSVVELPGGLTPRQRRERISQFAAASSRILLATDAASEGLNLQEHCRRLYHLELPWNPNRLEQRNGRIDRHGQSREPRIAYLFYAESPEDRVLDRLVRRISEMQGDQVSTPDIVGIVEATRLPERLVGISSEEDGGRVAESLMRVFEEDCTDFLRDMSPLLAATDDANAELDETSADPLLEDDIELERVMLRALGPTARPTTSEHEYRVDVPTALLGPGVPDRMPAVTFRRSVALTDSAKGTEFVHRLHPLPRAAAANARELLRGSGTGAMLPPYLAVRRLTSGLGEPGAVFTYVDEVGTTNAGVLAVGVSGSGGMLDVDTVTRALEHDGQPGDVPWDEAERAFTGRFESMRVRADELVLHLLHDRAATERAGRRKRAEALNSEVESYRRDRVKELEREEETERLGTRDQTELFRDTRTDWSARKAAVATQADSRLAQIDAWATVPEPSRPTALGVLLLFPEGDA